MRKEQNKLVTVVYPCICRTTTNKQTIGKNDSDNDELVVAKKFITCSPVKECINGKRG